MEMPVIQAAQVVLPCTELAPTLAFFTTTLGMRVEAIFPADHPRVAVVFGHGLHVRLDEGAEGDPGTLRLLCSLADGAGSTLVAPNGTRIELVDADPPIVVPPVQQSLVVTHYADDPTSGIGRAGMRYRDLIPGRQNGRFIASHISIPDGGPVPDYVHFHKVRFQMIYCAAGWVKVVYEDQGEPFVLEAGDCVIQPPRIRHRVLESSAGLEVIEIGCPADHETHADPVLHLPNPTLDPSRVWSGQRFVRHVAATAQWHPWRVAGFEQRDTGIGAVTDGEAGARVARVNGAVDDTMRAHDAEFVFLYVLRGACTLRTPDGDEQLVARDSVVVPAGMQHALRGCSADLELLDVSLPADVRLH